MFTAATGINQVAYVTRDLEASITWWTETLGVGPFMLLRDIIFDKADYLGEDRVVTYSAAVSYSGDTCIELIEPNGPSIFSDWLEQGRSGVQHLCVFSSDFNQTADDLLARGGKRIQGGQIGEDKLAYFLFEGEQDVIMEVAFLSEGARSIFDAVRQAAAQWDGKQRIFNFA